MIAKLPGGKKFMGDNLEIVCLLQAAELERLNDFLESYKIKYPMVHVGSEIWKGISWTGIPMRSRSRSSSRRLRIWISTKDRTKN